MDYVTKVGFVKEKNFNSPIIVENGEAYLVDNNMPAIQVGDVIGLISAKYSIDLKVCASEKLTLEEFHDRLYS